MDIKRLATHLSVTRWKVSRIFPRHSLHTIEKAIQDSESRHTGEIRFVVEGALDNAPLFAGQSARERAIDVFSQLRIWDTAENNGVLIYVLLADRDVEIVADRGIHAKVGVQEWESICLKMEADFKQRHYTPGVLRGIEAVSRLLVTHFPGLGPNQNELPDYPVVR